MFPTFTGTSRRPREVNLSGRNKNPFGALPTGSTTQGSSHNAVAQAQQERRARQLERDRLQAARSLQRTWRGFRSRRSTQVRFRAEWDERENTLKEKTYESARITFEQLALLLQFASPRTEADSLRVQRYAEKFLALEQNDLQLRLSPPWIRLLLRLAVLSLAIVLPREGTSNLQARAAQQETLITLLTLMTGLIPEELDQIAPRYFGVLREAMISMTDGLPAQGAISALLARDTSRKEHTYASFALEILTVADLRKYLSLDDLAVSLDLNLLMTSLNSLLQSSSGTTLVSSKGQGTASWLLAHLIYLNRRSSLRAESRKTLNLAYITLASTLLSDIADEIAQPSETFQSPQVNKLPEFVEMEILTLVNQETISSLLPRLGPQTNFEHEPSNPVEQAAVLAGFVLVLLRIFPARKDELRMWLYLGYTSTTQSGQDCRVPSTRFFWASLTETNVYNMIIQGPQDAVKVLKSSRSHSSTLEDSASNREWRVAILFLELYMSGLKIMDDEEFATGGVDAASPSSWTQQSALHLEQVRDLITFLKNLAFALYWHPSRISEPERLADSGSIASYFGINNSDGKDSRINTSSREAEVYIGVIKGVTLQYLKGVVTGLLRMLYERDSRRSFLSKDYWLMTKHFDMDGFISAVVTEEDYRRRLQEEGEEDGEVDDQDLDQPEEKGDSLVGSHRAQQISRLERLRRQQRKEARRKQLEEVTPRLEILQNMPFFIPFITRVEIFHEFVLLDKTRRRGGFVDPDEWRMSVFATSDVRGLSFQDAMNDDLSILGRQHATVKRDSIFEDAFEKFQELGEGLKEPIQITFVDQFDTPEAGIDGGGVTKEFLTSITKEAFTPSPSRRMFVENEQHLLYPNPSAIEEEKEMLRLRGWTEGSFYWNKELRGLLQRFEFLGRIIGKCLYEGILVDVHFAPFFLVKWALTGGTGSAANETGYRPSINDLRDLDEGLYQGLVSLAKYLFVLTRH